MSPHCKAYVALNFDTLANFENLVETYLKNLTQDLELFRNPKISITLGII